MILHNLSSRSLVLLDEIGRGTSTYDGMSIARAIVEYIHEYGEGAKTLFATHYHELNDLENLYDRVRNFHIAVKEVGKNIIFLRKLMEGGVAHSFGLHVARLAGMPNTIVRRAEEILVKLEQNNANTGGVDAGHAIAPPQDASGVQLSFYQLDDPVLTQIRDEILHLDIDNLTPMEALNKLNDIKKIVKGG